MLVHDSVCGLETNMVKKLLPWGLGGEESCNCINSRPQWLRTIDGLALVKG